MGKYDPLRAFLANRADTEIPMGFEEIEELIGAPLPPSAFKHPAWWSNNSTNSVITRAWLGAGFKTERVDIQEQRLVFRRARMASPMSEPSARHGNVLTRLRAALGGTALVTGDLTGGPGEAWDADQA